MTRRCLTVVVAGSLLLLALGLGWRPVDRVEAQEQEQQPDPSRVQSLMQMKLERAQQILEGLTLEDYDKVASGARSLQLLSMESGWNVYQTEEYRSQSQAFRHATKLILDAAADRDVNRATLGYVSMTVRCVDCHSYIRKAAVAEESERP